MTADCVSAKGQYNFHMWNDTNRCENCGAHDPQQATLETAAIREDRNWWKRQADNYHRAAEHWREQATINKLHPPPAPK